MTIILTAPLTTTEKNQNPLTLPQIEQEGGVGVVRTYTPAFYSKRRSVEVVKPAHLS